VAEEGEEEAGKGRAKESESFKSTLLPVILGLLVDLIMETFSGLSTSSKMIVIIGLSVVYSGAEVARKRPKSFRISSRAKTLMSIAFVAAIVLVLAASFILGLSLAATAFLVGWTGLMALALRFAQTIPEGNAAARVVMPRVAAFTLGAALSIGGAPVVDVAFGGPAHLTIENNCDRHLGYDPLGVSIPPGGVQTLEIPKVAIIVEHLGDRISASGSYGPKVEFPVTSAVDVMIDGETLGPGALRRIDLGDGEDHRIAIRCR